MKEKKGYTSHHVIYPNDEHKQDELVIPIRNKEHYALSMIQRFRHVSYGFLLSVFIELLKLLIRKVGNKLIDDAKDVK